MLVGDEAHIFQREVGAAARVAGLMVSTLPNEADGGMDPERVRAAVRGSDLHEPRTRLLTLENTHNYRGGTALSLERTRALTDVARETGLRTHLDGARIFNAELATGVAAAELAGGCDSVGFCLSKGLAAPVGSLLCGGGGVRGAGAQASQDAGRGDAPGGRAGGGGVGGAAGDGAAAGRGPRERAAVGAGIGGAGGWRWRRSGWRRTS